ncbi:MAG: bifunctional DNA-formamidopyrimidine glycosylase/DNA-(apurinic or apyrimidinic site) lyase [Pseudomonadota bacterium]|nr:bifunctional DNA-formamidopyrimidine glycosylase/DNA-(apurinic or apyrimidinic site) lyase [Pseudomonadota bacterium]
MPELPEVETVCRGLAPHLVGHVFTAVDQHRDSLRIPLPDDFPARLTGRRVTAVNRRAKYILVHLDDGAVMIAHLGMSGRMTIHHGADVDRQRHDHVVFHTDGDDHVVFNDTRRFGLITLAHGDTLDQHRLFACLGPEPLGNAFNGAVLATTLKGKRTPIKAALLDQRVVAGVGNIYACEALFHAGLSPQRIAYTVAGQRAERLAATVRRVLTEAIEAGGSSLRDYVQSSGELGYFQHRFAVYDREGEKCPGCDCGATVRRMVQAGRSTFYCGRRQR